MKLFEQWRTRYQTWLQLWHFYCAHKKIILFPLGTVLAYLMVLSLFLGSLFLVWHRPLRSLGWINLMIHFGFHWYYLLGMLLYFGCCHVIFHFFNSGLILYVGYHLNHKELSIGASLYRVMRCWRYFVWEVLVGTSFFLLFRVSYLLSSEWGDGIARLFGNISRRVGWLLLPVVVFEEKTGFAALQRASRLVEAKESNNHLQASPQRLFFVVSGLLMAVILGVIFSVHTPIIRMSLCFSLLVLFLGVQFFNLIFNLVFQTTVYLQVEKQHNA